VIRRAGLGAVILLLLATASVSAASKTVSIYAGYYSPAAVKVAMGGSVQWTNTTGTSHTVVSDVSFIAGWFFPTTIVKPHTTSSALTFPAAGTFLYHDSSNAALHGKVKVPMTADASVVSLGTYVHLTLGTSATVGTVYHLVYGRLNGGAWQLVDNTLATSTTFHPNAAGTWQLHTCLHQALSGASTGWSPILTVTVF
jgi:plastocyanin